MCVNRNAGRCGKSSTERPGEKLWTEGRACVRPCVSRGEREGEQEREPGGGRKGGRSRSGGVPRLEAPLIHEEYIHRLRRNFDHAVNRIPRRAARRCLHLEKRFHPQTDATRHDALLHAKGTLEGPCHLFNSAMPRCLCRWQNPNANVIAE